MAKILSERGQAGIDVEQEGCAGLQTEEGLRAGKPPSRGLCWEDAGPLPTVRRAWQQPRSPVFCCTCFSGGSFGAGSLSAPFLQVGGVYSYDCSFGHVPNVELMKFIAMATFGSYLSTCPEPEPGSLGLTVYHRAFLLYSFLRSGEALNPEYYCGEGRPGGGGGVQPGPEMMRDSTWGWGPRGRRV